MGNILIRVTLNNDVNSYLVRLHKSTNSIKITAQWILGIQGELYNIASVMNRTEPKVVASLGVGNEPQDSGFTDAIIEYPVQDDGVSDMWDMNQVIYENGYPFAKRIRVR